MQPNSCNYPHYEMSSYRSRALHLINLAVAH
nr:MAG TPA: hypothetical protein [Caudoviricetes sp.]